MAKQGGNGGKGKNEGKITNYQNAGIQGNLIEETRSLPGKYIEPGALQLTTLEALIDEGTWAKQKAQY